MTLWMPISSFIVLLLYPVTVKSITNTIIKVQQTSTVLLRINSCKLMHMDVHSAIYNEDLGCMHDFIQGIQWQSIWSVIQIAQPHFANIYKIVSKNGIFPASTHRYSVSNLIFALGKRQTYNAKSNSMPIWNFGSLLNFLFLAVLEGC